MVHRLSDMVARIKNSQARGRLEVSILRSRLCEGVLDCLVKEGYIRGYVIEGRNIRVLLRYKEGNPVIKVIECVSRPGFRQYRSSAALRSRFLHNDKIIFTSSSGIFCNSELVFGDKNVGGEPLIRIS